MKKLILYRLEIEGGTTLPKHLVYAKSRKRVERLSKPCSGTTTPMENGKFGIVQRKCLMMLSTLKTESGRVAVSLALYTPHRNLNS